MGDRAAVFLLFPESVVPLAESGSPFVYSNSHSNSTGNSGIPFQTQENAIPKGEHPASALLLALQVSKHPAKMLACPAFVS